MHSRPQPNLGKWFITILIIFPLLITQLYPLLWLLLYSLKNNDEILSGGIFSLPSYPRWENYVIAIQNGHYLQYLFNSLIVTFSSIMILLFFASSVSYVLSRFRFRFSQHIFLLFLAGMMLPMQSALLPLNLMFKNLHLLDTRWSLIFTYSAFSMPISVLILTNFMRSIPRELEEAAIIDGAGPIRLFTSIIFPISRPAMMTVSILAFISAWNEYIIAATFISSKSLKTLPFGAYSFVSQYAVNYGAIGAYLILAALPMILIYVFLSEWIMRGMLEGAVKG